MANVIVGLIFTFLGIYWLVDEYRLSKISTDGRIFIRTCLAVSLIIVGILGTFNLI